MNKNLRNGRVLLGLSQRALALRVGSHQPLISAFERGVLKPGPVLARRVAEVLGVPAEVLFGEGSEGDDEA